MIRRNIFANALGGSFTILLNLVLTPVQIHILGVERYGFLGFVASLQILLSALDLGLSTTVLREVARDASASRLPNEKLLRSVAAVYWTIASLIATWFMSATRKAKWTKRTPTRASPCWMECPT